MRLIPVMLALLLALSPGAVALQASAPIATAPAHGQTSAAAASIAAKSDSPATQTDTVRPAPADNTTAVMTLGTAPERTEFGTPTLALGRLLAQDHGRLQTELSVASLDKELEAADTLEQKRQTLVRYRYHIENRIISLKAEERQIVQSFSNGTSSRGEFLRKLGQLDAEAEQLRTMAQALQRRSENVGGLSMSDLVRTVNGKLTTLEGPVRDRIAKSSQGEIDSTRVFVATADTGVVMSTIVGGKYVREIVRIDHRNPSASGSLTLLEARDAVYEKYPWAGDNPSRGTSTDPYGSTNVYSVTVNHPHGTFVAYLDAGTEQVFKEIQHKQLTGENSLPPGPGVTNASNNLTLVVNRTYPGGPLRVNLVNETGAPLQGEITVAGEPAGRTDADGSLWTLGPAEQFEVSATYRGRTVNVTATPTDSS